MPIAASLNDIFQVRLVGSQEGQETNNIFHFSCVGASSDVETHLVTVLLTCVLTHVVPVASAQWELVKAIWKRVSPTLGPEFETLPASSGVGGGNAAALPSYASVVFSIRTALGGKSHRGRFYLPGIPEAVTTNSKLDAGNAYWTAMQAFAACLASEFFHPDPAGGTDLFDIGVYSRKIGGAAFPYGASGFTAANQIVPHLELATTRSRKLGRGA